MEENLTCFKFLAGGCATALVFHIDPQMLQGSALFVSEVLLSKIGGLEWGSSSPFIDAEQKLPQEKQRLWAHEENLSCV